MRDRALSEAAGLHWARRVPALRWQWAAASVCVAAAALWWIARGPELEPPAPRTADTAQRVEEVLTAIEQELDLTAAISSPNFPTDILLTRNKTDLFP